MGKEEYIASYKDAWEKYVLDICNFLSFVAYLEQKSKLDILKEFEHDVKEQLFDDY